MEAGGRLHLGRVLAGGMEAVVGSGQEGALSDNRHGDLPPPIACCSCQRGEDKGATCPPPFRLP